jgi:DNA repair ATPase RecN
MSVTKYIIGVKAVLYNADANNLSVHVAGRQKQLTRVQIVLEHLDAQQKSIDRKTYSEAFDAWLENSAKKEHWEQADQRNADCCREN